MKWIKGLAVYIGIIGLSASAGAADAPAAKVLGEAKALLLAEYYDDKLDAGSLDLAAVQGMVARLNGGKPEGPNALLDARATADLKRDLGGELVGIGTMIDFDDAAGVAKVEGLLPGSAAASAGIERGDRILAVDGVGFRGRPLHDVVTAIRGAEGSKVKLTLLRGSATVDKVVTRKRLTVTSVESTSEGELGLVTIRMFNERTPGELETALKGLAGKGTRRLLLDMRGNSGGLFEKSLLAAELLVPKGAEIVRTVARGGKVTRHVSKRAPVLGAVPLVVLVDGKTASSAEVLAEALRVSAGATLVGEKTFGKWRMETLRPLSDGYTLKFTIATLQSPAQSAGQSHDGVGVAPDVEVTAGAAPLEHRRRGDTLAERLPGDAQLKAAVHILRRLK